MHQTFRDVYIAFVSGKMERFYSEYANHWCLTSIIVKKHVIDTSSRVFHSLLMNTMIHRNPCKNTVMG